MARFRRGCGCAVVLAVLSTAPTARAQGTGIRVDSASPSAAEYQLPLERARADAQQGGPPAHVRPGERAAPAFGEGIQMPATSGKAPADEGLDPSRATTRRTPKKRASSGGGPRNGTIEATVTPPPLAKVAAGPGSSLLGVGALAAAVLALGAGVGLLLRSRSRSG
ncbi:MAG TPA: hypothetical protein VF526_16805 [Solirubrobacteraceae bacterium]|jgi:hypothetical protein